jgi:NAD-dependent dihydropyrimidine dehydrogenase PreA subunit
VLDLVAGATLTRAVTLAWRAGLRAGHYGSGSARLAPAPPNRSRTDENGSSRGQDRGSVREAVPVLPYLINDEGASDRERLQSQKERERYDDTTKCILCAACTTSCPIFWGDGEYIGPAAIVNAHRFIFDSRDRGKEERLKILAHRTGVFRCRTTFNCTDACPRGIHVTKAIQEVKRAILFERY